MLKAPRHQRISLVIGAFLLGVASVTGAQSESATSTVPPKDATFGKAKTSDKQQAEMLDFVKGREAPPSESDPTRAKLDGAVAAPEQPANSNDQDLRRSGSGVSVGQTAARSKKLGPNADIEQLMMIVMMESYRSASEDLKNMMERIRRLNSEKQEVRESLSVMWQEQSRLRGDPNLKAEQLEWAASLIRNCPPGTGDDCLVEQLRERTSVLKTSPVYGQCAAAIGCGGPTLSVTEDPDAGGEVSPQKQ